MSVQWWLRFLTVLGWPCLGVIVWHAPPLGSPMGLAFILATVVVPLATMLVILPSVLDRYFREYLERHRAERVDAPDERPKLEIVR